MADYITISELASILGQNITGEEDFIVTKNNTSYKITLSELDAYLRIQEVDKLSKNENLADLENKEIARTNLDVYSKDESNNILNNVIIDYVVPLGDGTSGDYVKNILPGTGIDILNGTGEGSETQISIANIGSPGTYTKVITNNKGQVIGNEFLVPSDIPELDASKITSGIISSDRLPSFVDDVLEVQNYSNLPIIGEVGKIYVVISDENKNGQTSTYRWTGSVYALVSNNLTAVDIKNLYESNSNTNAFTDTLLAKLNGIQNGAQVNTVNTVAGKIGKVTLTKLDVGLNNVQNIDTTNASNITSGTLNANLLPESGVIPSTYRSVTVDSKGRVTDGTNPTTIAEYEISDAYTKTEVHETLPNIGFNKSAAVTVTEGQIAWNNTEGTLDLGLMNGSTLQIGQENVRVIRNNSGSTITNGTPVMFNGTVGNSGRILVKPFTGGFNEAHLLYGVATQNILNGVDGIITIDGKVRGLNTTGSQYGETWTEGDLLYAKPNGVGMTNIEPSDTELKMIIAAVISSHATNGVLEIRIHTLNENMIAKRADKLSTPRTISGVSFDGTANINIPFSGIVSKPNTISDYGIIDAYTKSEIGTLLEFTTTLG